MRILLTNDDGIDAEGLTALERIAAKLSDDVWICAPKPMSPVQRSMVRNGSSRRFRIASAQPTIRSCSSSDLSGSTMETSSTL